MLIRAQKVRSVCSVYASTRARRLSPVHPDISYVPAARSMPVSGSTMRITEVRGVAIAHQLVVPARLRAWPGDAFAEPLRSKRAVCTGRPKAGVATCRVASANP